MRYALDARAKRLRIWLCFSCLGAQLLGCDQTAELSGELRLPDGEQFTRDVYPMLLRDCAFPACHGAPERFLRVLGPGRVRLTTDVSAHDAPLLEEVVLSYERARSVLGTADALEDSLLLKKPLDLAAGGQTHAGVDTFGRNVLLTKSDARYQLLRDWAGSAGTTPDADTLDAAFVADPP